MVRMLIAAVLAGVVMFFWGYVSHAVLGIADHTIKSIPDEAAVTAALRSGVREPGLYRYPGLPAGVRNDSTVEITNGAILTAGDALTKRYETEPHGLVLYNAPSKQMTGGQFGMQILSCTMCALVAAIMLAMANMRRFSARFFFVALLGVFATLAVNIPLWNWDGFPDDFTVGCAIDNIGAAVVAAFVLAAMLKPRAT